MKKLSKIFAVVMCLVLVLSMIPAVFAAECPLVDGASYKISATNANGTLWFDGTIKSGRFNCSANESDAVAVYVEAVTDGWKMYIMDGSAKKYIFMDDKAAGGAFVDAADDASVFVWNAELNTLVESNPDNARAFGSQDTSTYSNMSCYATSNTEGYNWGQFTALADVEEPTTPDVEEPTTPEVDKTADFTNPVGMAAVMVLALGAVVAVLISKKRYA